MIKKYDYMNTMNTMNTINKFGVNHLFLQIYFYN